MWRIAVLVLVVTEAASAQMPEYMTVCSRDDPNLNECVRQNMQKLLPKFVEGVEELDLPPLDPFVFDMNEIKVRQGNLHGSAKIRNSTAEGNSAIQFTQIRSNLKNPNKFEMDIDFFHSSLFIDGEYDVEGKLIVFNLNGSGIYNASLKNVNSTWKLRGELIEGEDGEKYMKLTRFGLAARMGSFKLYASNLFGGNKEINKAILGFINKSWRVLHRRLATAIDRSFNSSMLPIANKVFLKIPYHQLFPVDNATLPTTTEIFDATTSTTEEELDYDFTSEPPTPPPV